MILIQKTSDLLRGGGNVYYSAFYSAFLLSNTGRAKHNAATLLMDSYCVLAGKVAGGGAGCLTAVTGFELARETRFPTQEDRIPCQWGTNYAGEQGSGYHCHLLHQKYSLW